MRLLLLSNSRTPVGGYLTHALDAFQALADGRRRAWFVPFAAVTVGWDDFTAMVQTALAPIDLEVVGAHRCPLPGPGDVILVGGGNTFQLLAECRRRELLAPIRDLVRQGIPYGGWSAGANLACPTIRTTNDMPIVDPRGFDALGLLSFQINPHFTTAAPPGHQGETREQRLLEFVTVNPDVPVIGLPEGDWLEGRDATLTLVGPKDAVWIAHGVPTRALAPGPLPDTFRLA